MPKGSQMSQSDAQNRSARAKAFLGSELIVEFRKDMEETIKTQWALADDPTKREGFYQQLVALNNLFGLAESMAAEAAVEARTERRLAN